MSELLDAVITAHGGLDRWNAVRSVDVTFNFSGALLVPTLRRVVWRTLHGPLLSGPTSFVLDYTNVEVRT